jgi:hypothetical protein
MSCLTPNPEFADHTDVDKNPENKEVNGEYSELVQKSYDSLFEPWLKSDGDEEDRKPDEATN